MAEHIGGTNAKTEKNVKKAEGRVLFVDEAYTLSSKSGKDYGKETIEAMMAKMNANIDVKTKTQFLYLLGIPVKWKTSSEGTQVSGDEFPISLNLTIIRRWNSQKFTNKILLTYEMSYPHGVLDMFVDCFASPPKEIRAKWIGGLCSLLLDYIQKGQVKRLDFVC